MPFINYNLADKMNQTFKRSNKLKKKKKCYEQTTHDKYLGNPE